MLLSPFIIFCSVAVLFFAIDLSLINLLMLGNLMSALLAVLKSIVYFLSWCLLNIYVIGWNLDSSISLFNCTEWMFRGDSAVYFRLQQLLDYC